jgi:methionine sulfoxide reductase heme-binding subunit
MTSFSTFPVQRWQIVGWAIVAVSMMVGGIWLANGLTETGMRIAIRMTARSSCLLFLMAFLGSTWVTLWPSGWTQWLRSNRRYFGLAFAASHAWHAITIAGLAYLSAGQSINYSPGGMLGYVFIVLMAATSSRGAMDWLGDRLWRGLHTVGAYYIWIAFLVTFAKHGAISPIYPIMTGLLVIAMGFRVGNGLRGRLQK